MSELFSCTACKPSSHPGQGGESLCLLLSAVLFSLSDLDIYTISFLLLHRGVEPTTGLGPERRLE